MNTRTIVVAGMLSALVSATAIAAPTTSVLVVGADDYSPVANLQATGQFASVSYFDARSNTPTLSYLQGFNSVLAYTDYPPANAMALGDVLKQYVDGGGGVVLSTYSFSPPWNVAGGITTTGYSPLVSTGNSTDVSGVLAQAAPSAVFNGVNLGALTYFHNNNFAVTTLDVGATLLATDGVVTQMIAINANGRVIANNLFPGALPENNAEFYKLTANELSTVAAVPEPEIYAMMAAGLGLIGFARRRTKQAVA